ncbi:DUF6473 family protein [Sphingomonas sp. MMS24-J13]|uniref:DUF6473 family protein n=1 Tax=Sphingomonas sp. MMS24-J13 TaxID=3238686 RepID=UPI00384EDCC6
MAPAALHNDGGNMARAILHIGTEKTGTTAIQAYLAGNRAELRQAGIIYSSLPNGENHTALAMYAQDDDLTDDLRMGAGIDTPGKLAAFRETVEQIMADEVAAAAPNSVFIYSNEHCQSRLINPGEVERLYTLLRRFFKDIVVLVYLRRQDQVAVSHYSTVMKAGYTGVHVIDPPMIDRRFYDYDALLARWSSVFGRDKMVVARYIPSNLVGGSILPDFCNRMRIPKLRQIDMRRNESLRPPHQEFLRRVNERLPRFVAGALNPRRGDIESYVSAIGSGPGRRPSRATARAFYETWTASNEAVRQEYFASFDRLFDDNFNSYPEVEDPAELDLDDALDISTDIWAALATNRPAPRPAPVLAPRPAPTPAEPAALKALPPPGGVPRTGSGAVNAGYQRDDRNIVDYELWQLGDQQLRGPEPDRDRPYFAAIGAAQVFGRFVPTPFPDLIAEQIGMAALNLGMSGAGPSFFLQREEMIAAANRAEFVIVQFMSGRSISNSRAVLANNQGVMWLRDHPDASAYYAEDIYRHLLNTLSPAELAELRAENRENYVTEMQALLGRIERPKILLYWSKRPVNYSEGLDNLADYWGDFPHFVNRDVVETLIPFADHYAEVVTERGIPQPLFDMSSGAPIMMWPEDRFPNVHQREHNHYYPSPEMNEDAATILMPAVRQLMGSSGRPRAEQAPQPRAILVHMHIHRNAGSAIDRALQESFDHQWRTVSAPDPAAGGEAVVQAAASDAGLQAISAHQMRFPLPEREGLRFQPLLLLRNPIVRARSVYDFERSEQQRTHSDAFHTRMANQHDFRGWVEWCLSDTIASGPIANLQTRLCSVTNNGTRMDHWNHAITLRNFHEAKTLLSTAAVGTIEDFDASLIRIERALHLTFPRLRLLAYLENAAADEGIDLTTTEDMVREELGEALYDRLCAANAFDLLLWKRAFNSER